MAKVDVKCPFCAQTASVKKYGPGSAGHQHYRCQVCCRSFQVDYEYRACQPGMKEQVVDLAMYTAGIRNPQGWPSIPGAARYGCMNTVRAAAMKLTSRKKAKIMAGRWPHGASTIVV